jgi:hypothetical protein
MKLRKFLKAIEELKPTEDQLTANDILVSVLDDWEIDVLRDEFQAYGGIFYQMVFCLDTINLFPGLTQLRRIDENAPDPFVIWGYNSFYEFHYAFNYKTDEVVLLDDLRSPEPSVYCAVSDARFLDCLYVVAQYFKLQLLEPDKAISEKDDWITKAAEAAGGQKYLFHCKILIG